MDKENHKIEKMVAQNQSGKLLVLSLDNVSIYVTLQGWRRVCLPGILDNLLKSEEEYVLRHMLS